MLRRVFAWVLLAGFILLLLNITIFQVFLMPSVAIYAVIAIGFILSGKSLTANKSKASEVIFHQEPDENEEMDRKIQE